MICITGNTHGDLRRFKHQNIRKLRRGDTLIICGDFGFLWDGSRAERRRIKWLGKRRYNVLFVDGCHENFKLLEQYDVEQWRGGQTRRISGRLRQLLRGEVFDIDGKKIFTFGGGHSEDKEMREQDVTWFEQESPSSEEITRGTQNLAQVDNQVDFIVTHEAPTAIHEMLDMDGDGSSFTCTYLNGVCKQVKFKCWFFGKRHMNKRISPQYHAIFDQVAIADPAHYKRDKYGEIKVK